jgi:hypothetical protein
MLARLGDVLYWAGAWLVTMGHDISISESPNYGILLVPALVVWLIGRAARYALAGR